MPFEFQGGLLVRLQTKKNHISDLKGALIMVLIGLLFHAVDMVLRNQDYILHILQDNIHMERNRMKQEADQYRCECTFQVNDMFFLRLQPYKQSSLKIKGSQKLAPKFYGPYKVLQKIGYVAYKLELPPSSHIHLVFHVYCLKKAIGTNIRAQTILLGLDNEGSIIFMSETILNKMTLQHCS